MKTANAIKVLSKYATVEHNADTRFYWATRANDKGELYTISFIDQGGEAICLHEKRTAEKDDPQSDYFAGSYPPSLKRALEWAWDIGRKPYKEVA